MKTVLILGCGYLGRALASALLAGGDRVLALTRNRETAAGLRADGADVFEGALQEKDWHDWGRNVDAAINCVGSAGSGLEGYRKSYIEGNQSFAAWMGESGFEGPAIYTSSVSVYPDRRGAWVDEDDAEPSSERSRLMLDAESIFSEGADRAVKTVLRLGGIYGPGRSFLADRVRLSEGTMPGYGDYFLNLIRLEDIVSAIEAVLNSASSTGGVYNVVDDRPRLKADLVSALAAAMKRDPVVFDPQLDGGRSSRRSNGGPPANRRVSNKRFRQSFDWVPRHSDALQGMLDLVSS